VAVSVLYHAATLDDDEALDFPVEMSLDGGFAEFPTSSVATRRNIHSSSSPRIRPMSVPFNSRTCITHILVMPRKLRHTTL
jgi:hypothetical protein